ncbi:MAG: TatD family hydrolase [Actinomycetaceae bacterium]|nr:TatD family hydrolase [Actinomycetaceae bacterium]
MSKKNRSWPEPSAPLARPVTDNHTHLPVGEWEIPRAQGVKLSLEEQLRRAWEVGIERIITVGCEIPDFDPTLEIARRFSQGLPDQQDQVPPAHFQRFPRVRAALALHPNEAPLHAGIAAPSPDGLQPRIEEHHCDLDSALAEVEKRLDNPAVVAVGETGVDRFRTADAGIDAQKRSFAAHLELAFGRDLPVQIHDRQAHADCLDVLYDMKADTDRSPIVFHCFSGGVELAEHCAKNGWYASFAGPVTFKANDELRQALLTMPKELVLVETDAPYLTPMPHRGQPNASYVMAHTVRFIAQLWDMSESDACDQLSANTVRVYGQW